MKIEGDKVTFSSGRKAYANNGVIGIGPEMRPSQGWDGGFSLDDDDDLSTDERRELSEYMIEQWRKFADT
jgi:hypothetical protein